MTNIIGTYECKVDAKGRLMLPTALKKQLTSQLESGFVLKRSMFEKCIELYPMSEWNDTMSDVTKLSRFKRKNVEFIRLFTAGVRIVELDVTGRLLIPKDLVGFSSITNNIVLASAGTYVEIWDKDAYEEKLSNPETDIATLAEEVMGSLKDRADDLP
ncbi:MAG: division/cell wall cluster transcriptional repressor MraZ [Flavobacteriales bacterium]|nr:division/cell wall cluster transcriptional repressor MraZ [Flavobacteriales bacterium]